jgi:hypothetical protein
MAARKHARNLFMTALSASLAWPACGGSSPEPTTAEHADGAERRSSGDRDDDTTPSDSDADEPAVPKKAACDDGTCTPCGDAQCPVGWYCDESAKGGPACGWLPECAKKPTCACVKRVFSGSCEERSGGLYVKE